MNTTPGISDDTPVANQVKYDFTHRFSFETPTMKFGTFNLPVQSIKVNKAGMLTMEVLGSLLMYCCLATSLGESANVAIDQATGALSQKRGLG